MRSFLFFFSILFLSSLLYSETITVDDALSQKGIEAVRMNPDGSSVLALVKSADPVSNLYRNEIFLIPADTNQEIRKLVNGIAPQWSPDGKSFSYVKASSGQLQIFISSITASNDEQNAASAAGNGIIKYNWSPEGRFIAYTAVSGSSEDPVYKGARCPK